MAANIEQFVRRLEAIQIRERHLEIERLLLAHDQSVRGRVIFVPRFHRLVFWCAEEEGEEAKELPVIFPPGIWRLSRRGNFPGDSGHR